MGGLSAYAYKLNTGNRDLDEKGIDLYSFSSAYGKYLDFAGFWIKHINPHITLSDLSLNGDEYVFEYNNRKCRLLFKKESDRWAFHVY